MLFSNFYLITAEGASKGVIVSWGFNDRYYYNNCSFY